ncbi:exonuclease SbcCD subunit D [Acidobacteriota bacterium]
MGVVKLLFLADSHLGFDFPFRPRIERRRRGEDFFKNFDLALEPARKGEVHAVIHGGDLLFRSKVPAKLVDMAMQPLKEIADQGAKIFLVPGNHERSRIPFGLLSIHPNIKFFRNPATFTLQGDQFKLALAGFPYYRNNVRWDFPKLLRETGWYEVKKDCDASILCVHHCFEGATVGPKNYMFRYNDDVIQPSDVPKDFIAVCTGHVHRFQVLTRNLKGHSLNSPILYPGSIERTSFAEKYEKKGYLRLDIQSPNSGENPVLHWKFQELPSRQMINIQVSAKNLSPDELRDRIEKTLTECDPNGIVRIHIQGPVNEDALSVLTASSLRTIAPQEMNVSLRFEDKPYSYFSKPKHR